MFTVEIAHADGCVWLSHDPWGGEGLDFPDARRLARDEMADPEVVDVRIRECEAVMQDPAYAPRVDMGA